MFGRGGDQALKGKYDELRRDICRQEEEWSALQALLQRAVTRVSIAAAGQDSRMEPALDDIRRAVKGRLDAQRLESGLARLADAVKTLEDRPAPGPADTAPGAPADLRALLRALVQRLAGIPGLEAVAQELGERLQDEVELGEWPGLLDSLADALEQVLEGIRRQKAELEAFIGQVDQQLGRFQEFVRSSEADLDSARSGREQLSSQLGDEMQSLRAHMDGAGDVDELKGRVLGSLNQIAAQLQSFRDHEESRLAQAEERNQRLVRQLDALGFEAKRLREENDERLEQLMLDPLTKVHSRFAYEKRLAEEFSRWQRHGQPLGFVIWDIDRFKAINDNYGHKVGDRLLQMVARLLARHTRQSDFLARIGGEEFVMLLPGAGAEEAITVAGKLRQVIAETGFHYRRQPRPVTVSAGVTEFREGDRPDDVYQRADAALYRAKEAGRNRCEMG